MYLPVMAATSSISTFIRDALFHLIYIALKESNQTTKELRVRSNSLMLVTALNTQNRILQISQIAQTQYKKRNNFKRRSGLGYVTQKILIYG
jgi:fumarate hydratase class II